ncbi:IclR family transcriptional regulator [Granulicoccus sp. GXG6511]|uniref:IclR family transcriptional regulator n=1 Tax=Granulicoccus sp. GXG6511 TaxID=3381351 RepID=UPI003D7C59F3
MSRIEDDRRTSTPKQAEEAGGLRSVGSALDLLECFATEEELGVSDLARRLGIAKSTAHRLLSTLRSRGFIEQDEDSGRYRLGLHLFELGHLAQVRHPLRAVAMPICLDLSRRTGLTVNLSVCDGADIVFIERLESPESGRNLSESGRRLPSHVASSGKAIAAWNPEFAQVRAEAGFPPRARSTVRTRSEWEAALRSVRKVGYALSEDESYDGISSVAVPIMDARGPVTSALSFLGRRHDLGMRLPLLVQVLQRSARRIAHEMMRRPGGMPS